MQSAAKVGLLLVVFVALLVGGYAVLGRTLLAPKEVVFYADFPDAGGVTPGTPVLMAGVKIGTVANVSLLTPRVARMKLSIKEGVSIPIGTDAVVPSTLVGIGSAEVFLDPPKEMSGSAPAGTVLVGRRGNALDSVLPNSEATVEELTKTLAAVRKILEDERLMNRMDTLLATSNETLEKFGSLAGNVDQTLVRNQAQIDKAILASSEAVQDVQRVTRRVAQLVEEGKLQQNAEEILDNVSKLTAQSEKLVVSINDLVTDPTLRKPASEIAANMQQISETGKSIAANTEQITKEGITISKNVTAITDRAITLTDQANEIAKKAIGIENQISETLGRVGGFFTRRPGTGGLNELGARIDLHRETDPSRWRTDFTLTYPLSDGTLYAGLFDAFEANRLTIQIGKPATQNLSYRYGIFASKPGAGVDYTVNQRLFLRGDVWDINNLRLDLRARYEFGNGLSGWVGVDRVFRDNAPTIGIGIRR